MGLEVVKRVASYTGACYVRDVVRSGGRGAPRKKKGGLTETGGRSETRAAVPESGFGQHTYVIAGRYLTIFLRKPKLVSIFPEQIDSEILARAKFFL